MRPKEPEHGRHDATLRDDAPDPVAAGRHDATMRSEELADIAHAVAQGRAPQPVVIAPHPAAAARPKLDRTLPSPNEGPIARELMAPILPVAEPKGGPGGTAIMGTAPAQIQALQRELASGPVPSPGPMPSSPITAPPPRPVMPRKTGVPWWVGVLVFGGLVVLIGLGAAAVLVYAASANRAEKELLAAAQEMSCPASYACRSLEHRKATYRVCSAPPGVRYGGGDVVFLSGEPNRVAVVKKIADTQSYDVSLEPSGVAANPRNEEVLGRVCRPGER